MMIIIKRVRKFSDLISRLWSICERCPISEQLIGIDRSVSGLRENSDTISRMHSASVHQWWIVWLSSSFDSTHCYSHFDGRWRCTRLVSHLWVLRRRTDSTSQDSSSWSATLSFALRFLCTLRRSGDLGVVFLNIFLCSKQDFLILSRTFVSISFFDEETSKDRGFVQK